MVGSVTDGGEGGDRDGWGVMRGGKAVRTPPLNNAILMNPTKLAPRDSNPD